MPDVPAEREVGQLRVVFGAGQVGMALAGHLAGLGLPGAVLVYQCLSAPYTQWPERFPPLQHGVLTGRVLDTSKYQSTLGPPGTPTAAAIATTVAWYRNRLPRQD